MRCQPLAKVVTGNLDRLVGFVPGVDLGVDGMGLGEKVLQEGVYMGGERAEGRVVAHEAVDVDDEESPLVVVAVAVNRRRHQRLGRRRPGVARTPQRAGETI